MADGDYERGRGREIAAIAAKLKRLRNGQDARCPSTGGPRLSRPHVFVFNGWAASPHAWNLCRFMQACGRLGEATLPVAATSAALPRVFSYVEQLDGEPEKAMEGVERCVLVG